ncbi:putative retrograde regulation protein 2 [Venustampulla echinocandica]|uniref:Putative retrograde regulation protein 2 n=1 Tax=Venustampulla echinocandica TaxID=2656787 RepID=A0A370T939_9HELO|nr:putative retrograde regulation protein 2 [Venustampulla echinocandica]RDL29996.1 putative retrograde regulation protein 2 [Venustampulla echinocandica]
MAATAGDVIDIGNFATKLPQWKASSITKPLYGLVDMGSNGIRFSISDLSPPRSRLLPCVYRERAAISLYDALHESTPNSEPFHFSRETIVQVAQTLARFKSICNMYDVQKENISVFATEAMRTAKNKDEMLFAIKESSGLAVDILSPGVESLFGAMGARSGFQRVNGLFMDLGGGSVQMTYVNSTAEENYDVLAADAARSLPFGAAKLSMALGSQNTAHAAKAELRARMRETFEELTTRFPKLKKEAEQEDGITIYFCGGGFRGYGSMLMHTDPIQPYPIPVIGGYTVQGHRFIKWREMLHANNHEGKVFGMSTRRRDQFPAIATVVQAIVEAVPKIKQVVFCSGGNREGVLYMKLPVQVRESNPLSFILGEVMSGNDGIASAVSIVISSGLANPYPALFSSQILQYVASHTWLDMGNPDSSNSAKSLHNPISGLLAGIPGMTHETRAILALTMCARWGSDLAPGDKKLADNLQSLIGHELSWWCRYIGTIARLLALVVPTCPSSEQAIDKALSLQASASSCLGKKGHKAGIRLRINIRHAVCPGLNTEAIEGLFAKVGKNLQVNWKVELDVVEL